MIKIEREPTKTYVNKILARAHEDGPCYSSSNISKFEINLSLVEKLCIIQIRVHPLSENLFKFRGRSLKVFLKLDPALFLKIKFIFWESKSI